MKSFLRLLHFSFVPRSTDLALLVLRVWLGASMLILHGWSKLTGFRAMAADFPDPIGLGSGASAALAVFAEVFCAAALAVGLFTRFAAAVLVILMLVAFFVVHGRALSGPGSGEMAFLYLGGFVAIFLAGPGRFSVDRRLGAAA